MRLRGPFLAAVICCLVGLAGAGCAPDPGAEEARERPQEVVLRRANGPEPDTLDPQRAEDESSREIIRDLYEGLVGELPDGTLAFPCIPEAWLNTGRVSRVPAR
jgi:oligopeptide transport system substrate-binding protein